MSIRPLPSQHPNLAVQELPGGELVVYDLAKDKVHSLNPAAALVWRQQGAKKSLETLAGLLETELGLPRDVRLVESALVQLREAGLLEQDAPARSGPPSVSRRQLAKGLGLSVGVLPLVMSLVSPTAAHAAASCGGPGANCRGAGRPPCCPPLTCNGSVCA